VTRFVSEVSIRERGALFGAFAFALLLLLTSAPEVLAQGARLFHVPPGGAVAGTSLELEAVVEGSSELPTEAKLFFRPAGADAFSSTEMKVDRYTLRGEIPAAAFASAEVYYYFQTDLAGGASLSLPLGAPSSGEYFRVAVRKLETQATGSSAFLVLSPDPGARLSEEQTVIAVSILQSVEKVDPSTIRITLDGKDFTSSAKISAELIVLPLPAVRPGSHTVAILRDVNGRREKVFGWGFEGPLGKKLRPKAGPIQANVTAGTSMENVSEQDRDISFLDGRVNGSYGKFKWGARAYLSTLEKKSAQPQNRYLGTLEYGSIALRVGDVQPRFSEFTLWGVRTRGVEFSYHGFAFNLDVAQGELVRAVDGTSRLDTTWVTDDNTGDTLKSIVDPALDSIIVASVVQTAGRFKRELIAVKPGFPLSDNLTLSFNFAKAKDNVASIDWGRAPKDNLVLGFDIQAKSKSRRFLLNSETAISMFNSDISEGAMEDAKPAESMIIVNQYFEPLPTDTSILSGDAAVTELMGKLMDELIQSSLAHRTTLTLNYFHNELKLGYKTIGRSFKSLGSPTVLTDVAGVSIEDRIRMINSRLYLTIGYELYADNINGRAPTTSDRDIIRAGVSFYSPPSYPNVNLSVRMNGRKNDGVSRWSYLPDGDSLRIDTRIDNEQSQISFSLDQSFKFGGLENFASISWNQSVTDDNVNPIGSLEMGTIGLNFNSKRQPWEWRGSFSLTSQTSQNGASNIDYNSVNLGTRYALLADRLFLGGGFGITMASGGVDNLSPQPTPPADSPKRQEVSFSRMELNAGAEYQITPRHLLTLSAYKATHADDSFVENWSGSKSYNSDSPSFVKQNDTSVRLVYSFKM